MIDILIVVSLIFLGVTFGYVEMNQKTTMVRQRKQIRIWHWTKGFFQIFIFSSIAIGKHGLEWSSLLYWLQLLALTAIVFNISKEITKGNKPLHLGEHGIEKHFQKFPIVYYLLLVGLIIVAQIFIINLT